MKCSVTQPCPTLCDTVDYSPPGSSVHGISQARMLDQVAVSFSRGSFQPWDQTCVSRASCIVRSSWILYHRATWEALLIIKVWNHSFKYIQWNLNIIVVWYCHPHWNRWSCSMIHESFVIFELIPFSLFYLHVTYLTLRSLIDYPIIFFL